MEFKDFKTAVQVQFQKMSDHQRLFKTNTDKLSIWNHYLSSFPEGSNPIFKQRTEHDCQGCKQFIRACGNVVAIKPDLSLESIWDVNIGGAYQVVADALSEYVKSRDIQNQFLHDQKTLGVDKNRQLAGDTVVTWEHFYFKLPTRFVKSAPGEALSAFRSSRDVFERGLQEISMTAVDTVIELIEQQSLYRGEEHLEAILSFKSLLQAAPVDGAISTNPGRFSSTTIEKFKNFTWLYADMPGARIRNTAIGTLLTDISAGEDLDAAVKLFESKVAPANYKRPSAVVTKGMIKKAQEKCAELGIEDSLYRRYATAEDITVDNVLFADREARKSMVGDVFDDLIQETPEPMKKMEKVEEIAITDFLYSVLPYASSIELLLENKHTNNLMSLIAPAYSDAPNILKWDNNFSWTYRGEVTDSIKERVKAAGGDVHGVLRCSLSWHNTDDLDIHVIEPDKFHIYYSNKVNTNTGGHLDVDMNANGPSSLTPVENITWPREGLMKEGVYEVFVNQYSLRNTENYGFVVEIEHDGQIQSFEYNKKMKQGENVQVARFKYSKEKGIEMIASLPSTTASKEVWGLHTNNFQRTSMIMNSPNHWDGSQIGNKHYFFILEDCLNPGKARGLYNEFLKEDLREHRKVFEVLGSKLKAPESDNQLSGLGFSSTQRNSVCCRVAGSFTRSLKINF